MPWSCFMVEPTGIAQESLRRFVYASPGQDCPVHGFHNASVPLGIVGYPFREDGRVGEGLDNFPHDDPRWPSHCACGYAFQASDEWQHNLNRIYRHTAEGTGWPLAELPPGAMYDQPGYPGDWRGADGRCLVLMLPDRSAWVIDGPASNAPGQIPAWTRTGEPPRITAQPSIDSGGYHGWLQDGVLTDDLAGRTYPS